MMMSKGKETFIGIVAGTIVTIGSMKPLAWNLAWKCGQDLKLFGIQPTPRTTLGNLGS